MFRHLEAVDFEECRRRQAVMQTVRGREDRAAQQLGLATIFAQVGVLLDTAGRLGVCLHRGRTDAGCF